MSFYNNNIFLHIFKNHVYNNVCYLLSIMIKTSIQVF